MLVYLVDDPIEKMDKAPREHIQRAAAKGLSAIKTKTLNETIKQNRSVFKLRSGSKN